MQFILRLTGEEHLICPKFEQIKTQLLLIKTLTNVWLVDKDNTLCFSFALHDSVKYC